MKRLILRALFGAAYLWVAACGGARQGQQSRRPESRSESAAARCIDHSSMGAPSILASGTPPPADLVWYERPADDLATLPFGDRQRALLARSLRNAELAHLCACLDLFPADTLERPEAGLFRVAYRAPCSTVPPHEAELARQAVRRWWPEAVFP